MRFLNEDSRKDFIQKSKNADDYVPSNQHLGKNRYIRRKHSTVKKSVANFNRINMDELFKFDLLRVDISVKGETDEYTVTIVMPGVIEYLREHLKDDDPLDLKLVYRAVMQAFNSDDIRVHCTCPDFCLTGDNEIKLLNGENVKLCDLLPRFESGEKLWVYSVDNQGNFKPGKISNVWVSGYEQDFIKVTLDNGESITTTPNHRYMLRTGEYCEAQNLKVGTSLMPLYFKYENGYELVKDNYPAYPTTYRSVYKTVANTLLQDDILEAYYRSGEDAVSIHHRDFNKLNNNPTNLYPMGHQEHYLWHSNHVKNDSERLQKWLDAGKEYWQKPESRLKQADVMRDVITKYWEDLSEDQKEINAKMISDRTKQFWKDGKFNTEKFNKAAKERGIFLSSPEIEELAAQGVRKYWNNLSGEDYQSRIEIAKRNVLKAQEAVKGVPKSESFKKYQSDRMTKNNPMNNPESREKISEKAKGMRWWTNGFERRRSKECPGEGWVIGRSIKNFNHKIVSIETVHYDEPTPVYDISVDDYNNFLVSAGVILHNCYRFDYWLTKKGLNAGDPQTDPGKGIVNPHDTKGNGCKHILLCLSNNGWIMKVASVIRNYVNYMSKHQERLYKTIIYPALHGHEYQGDDGIQQELKPNDNGDIVMDTSTTLDADQDTLDTVNKWAKTKNQFKKGNQSGIQYTAKRSDGQFAFTKDTPKLFNYDDLVSNK